MRQVGDIFGKRRADRFIKFLVAQGVDAESREDGEDHYSLWVINEDQMPLADEHYRAFKAAPDAPAFDTKDTSSISPNSKNSKLHGATRAPRGLERGRYIDVRNEIFARKQYRKNPATITIIALSVIATLASGIPSLASFVRSLYFSEYLGHDFPEILQGQLWRLFTPIFIHGGVWHLLFNMMWIYQLGGAMETEEGSLYLALFTATIAAAVNCAEYLVSGPLFIGMSGVVYAMLGYIWIMSRHQIGSRYELGQGTALIMVGWLVLCLVGIIPGVANTQHVGGLLLGGLWGLYRSRYFSTWLRQRRQRR